MEILVGRHFPPNVFADAARPKALFGVRRLAVLLLHKVNRAKKSSDLSFSSYAT